MRFGRNTVVLVNKAVIIAYKAKKMPTMTHMPNTIFSCQTTLKKAKLLEFGLKNANLATLLQRTGVHIRTVS